MKFVPLSLDLYLQTDSWNRKIGKRHTGKRQATPNPNEIQQFDKMSFIIPTEIRKSTIRKSGTFFRPKCKLC